MILIKWPPKVPKWLKRGSFWYKVSVVVLCVCVLFYTVYHISSLFGEEISTFAAGVTTETESLSGMGYVFRDETVLRSSNEGVVDYLCDDGTKVRQGDSLAVVYGTGTQGDRRRIEALDEKIDILSRSEGANATNTDIAQLQKEINDDYYILVRMLAGGETGGLSEQIADLLVGMDRLSVITEEDSAVTGTLEELKSLKNEMISSAGASVEEFSSESGYFYTSADGYEDVFTMDALENLTVSSFTSLISQRRALSSAEGKAYGRLAKSSEWGFVMEVPKREAKAFAEGESYSLEFLENHGIGLPMTLDRIIDASSRSSVLLVFKCDRLPDGFDFTRCQSVRIDLSSVSGIYVPMRAVYELDGYEGVYILKGSVVHFRYIDVVYEGSDYYLVSEEGIDDGYPYLAPNDLVILNGTNMFEGRILD